MPMAPILSRRCMSGLGRGIAIGVGRRSVERGAAPYGVFTNVVQDTDRALIGEAQAVGMLTWAHAASRHAALARATIAPSPRRRVDPPRLKFLSRGHPVIVNSRGALTKP